MSWLLCEICESPINTDDHPEAYDELVDQWLCPDHMIDHEKDTLLASSEERVWV